MNSYRVRYFAGGGEMKEVTILAPTAEDALTIYSVRVKGALVNQSSLGPLVFDVADITPLETSPSSIKPGPGTMTP